MLLYILYYIDIILNIDTLLMDVIVYMNNEPKKGTGYNALR